jgi:hypothetical protein
MVFSRPEEVQRAYAKAALSCMQAKVKARIKEVYLQ